MAHGTIDELISTGKFDIIRSEALRNAILRYTETRHFFDYVDRKSIERTVPHIVFVEKHIRYKNTSGNGGLEPIKWDQLGIDFDALCKTDGIINAISLVQSNTYMFLTRMDEAIGEERALIDLIKSKMKNGL